MQIRCSLDFQDEVYLHDCISLKDTHTKINEDFLQGNFIVHQTERRSSSLPMDQALEKAYNKVAKGAGGVIGFTRRKEVVARWNIIKHEKSKIFSFLKSVCKMDNMDELSTHHEFSPTF